MKAGETARSISWLFIVRSGEFGLAPGSAIIPPTPAAGKQLRELGMIPVKLGELDLRRIVAREKRSGEAAELAKILRQAKLAVRILARGAHSDQDAFLPKSEEHLFTAISESAFAPGPRAKAALKGIEIAKDDLRNSGGSYDLEQVRRLMHGVSRQRIDKRVREGSLLAVPGPSSKRHYPAVQFKDDGTVVEGLQAVREALPTKNGFAILNFLIHPDRRLAKRKPIDLLKAGEVDLVVEAARRLGEQGA